METYKLKIKIGEQRRYAESDKKCHAGREGNNSVCEGREPRKHEQQRLCVRTKVVSIALP
jgi:hypothetical protein